MRNIYFDTETTGFKPGQIAELSLIVEDESTLSLPYGVRGYNYFFKVDNMPEGAYEVHGLDEDTLEKLSGGLTFADHCKEIYNIVHDGCLIAHNEKFDESFLTMELWRCGVQYTPISKVCTMNGFRDVLRIKSNWGNKYKNPSVDDLIHRLHLDTDKIINVSKEIFRDSDDGHMSRHDSRFDAAAVLAAVRVYRDLLNNTNVWKPVFCTEGALR